MTDHDETIDVESPLELFDPTFTWKRKTITNFHYRYLQVPIFRNGLLVYNMPSINAIRSYRKSELDSMWNEVLRLQNPHKYYVDLSTKLWNVKNDLIRSMSHLVPGDGE
ncbi:MAG: hypothetical protein MZU97_04860 [Bacillus subtilis]|nr:hypothetical protein [Bacillus subtilis]